MATGGVIFKEGQTTSAKYSYPQRVFRMPRDAREIRLGERDGGARKREGLPPRK